MHWAEQYAKQVIRERGPKDEYVVESRTTPSGVVHAGNFRETITQDFVQRALKKHLGKDAEVKFYYAWDDFDRFRKVPKGIPEEFKEHLFKPLSDVPDPWGCHKSYARHFQGQYVEELDKLGIQPTYVYEHEEFRKGTYSDLIKTAMQKTGVIIEIMNKFRSPQNKLPEDWYPSTIYCDNCSKDTNRITAYDGDYEVKYKCECGSSGKLNFKRGGDIKLRWRVDWPAKWYYYGVDFEPSGKDHQAAGGSWDTGIMISDQVYDYKPPIGPMYEFVSVKGEKGKMSSSKGNVVTISDLLEIYEPEIIRFMYTAKINKAFEIPFDTDIFNKYSYYDEVEQIYFDKIQLDSKKDKENNDAIYGLSQLNPDKETSVFTVQPPFNFCTMIAQVTLNIEHAIKALQRTEHVPKKLTKPEIEKIEKRLKLAGTWAEKYAPEEYQIKVIPKIPVEILANLSVPVRQALREIARALYDARNPRDLQFSITRIIKEKGLEPKEFYGAAYLVLLGKPRGPNLANFLFSLENDFVKTRFADLK
jgi:lysyl-tRNA synthetase class 1